MGGIVNLRPFGEALRAGELLAVVPVLPRLPQKLSTRVVLVDHIVCPTSVHKNHNRRQECTRCWLPS